MARIYSRVIGLVLLAALQPQRAEAAACPTRPVAPADLQSYLQGFLQAQAERARIPGAVAVVVDRDGVVAQAAYGLADVAAGRRVDPDRTLFRIASITKTFTAMAVMQLVERGLVGLDTPIDRLIDVPVDTRLGSPTVRQLLTHTAGFDEHLKNGHVFAPTDLPRSLRARLAGAQVHQVYAPGTTVAYSNYGFGLLGRLVEVRSGMSWSSYVERHILAPLRMRRTGTRQPFPPRLAREVSRSYPPGSREAAGQELLTMAPEGAIAASAVDMGRFMRMVLAGGTQDGVTVLLPAAMRAMLSPQHRAHPATSAMGLGFYESSRWNARVIRHDGGLENATAAMVLLPECGLGLFAAYNSRGVVGGSQTEALVDAVLTRILPKPTPPSPWRGIGPEVSGDYWSSRRPHRTVAALTTWMAGPLTVSQAADRSISIAGDVRPDGTLRRWVQTGPTTFEEDNSRTRIGFVTDRTGQAVAMATVQPTWIFERVPWWAGRGLNRAAIWAVAAGTLAGAALLVARLLGRRATAGRWTLVEVAAIPLPALGMVLWAFARFGSDHDAFTSANDSWLYTIYAVGTLCLLSPLGAAAGLAGGWAEVGRARRVAGLTVLAGTIGASWLATCWNLVSWSPHY